MFYSLARICSTSRESIIGSILYFNLVKNGYRNCNFLYIKNKVSKYNIFYYFIITVYPYLYPLLKSIFYSGSYSEKTLTRNTLLPLKKFNAMFCGHSGNTRRLFCSYTKSNIEKTS